MNYIKNNIIGFIALIVVLISAFGGSHAVQQIVGAQVQNDLWLFTGTPTAIQATGDIYAAAGFTEGGLTVVNTNIIASSTATTTLTAKALSGSTIIFNIASSTTQNLTLPSTTTLRTAQFLPNIGDFSRVLIDLASTTAGGATLSAPTGITLKFATSTAGTAAGGNIISLTLLRDTANTLIGLVGIQK